MDRSWSCGSAEPGPGAVKAAGFIYCVAPERVVWSPPVQLRSGSGPAPVRLRSSSGPAPVQLRSSSGPCTRVS
ncbi:uncharacterized protein V6R79_007296 [Siganus canaliculatus]